MASQLAMLQAAGQASALASQAQNAVEGEQKRDPVKDGWFACCAAEGEEPVPDIDIDDIKKPRLNKLTLRINVFAGQDITSFATYLEINITDYNENWQEFSKNEPISTDPSWNQTFEIPLTLKAGTSTDCTITVWGRSGVHGHLDKPLGHCVLKLMAKPTEYAVMCTEYLQGVPAPPLGDPPKSRIKLVYELLDGHASDKPLEGASDLQQIASLGEAGQIETLWYIAPRLHSLKMAHLAAKDHYTYRVSTRIVKRRSGSAVASAKDRETVGRPRTTPDIAGESNDKGEFSEKVLTLSGDYPWQPKTCWSLQEQHAHLSGYALEVTVKQVENADDTVLNVDTPPEAPGDAKPRTCVVARWEETLINIVGQIEEQGHKNHFRAQLVKPSNGAVAGELEMVVDMWDLKEHREPPRSAAPRLRAGRKIHKDTVPQPTYVLLWLDRFVPSNADWSDPPNPFIRVTIGKDVQETKLASESQRQGLTNCERIAFDPVKITMSASIMRMRLEVFNKKRNNVIGLNERQLETEDELIGEVMLRDLIPKEVYWRHIFAGSSLASTIAGKEISIRMGKGFLRPSTFRCSLGIWMQPSAQVPDNFHSTKFHKSYEQRMVVVRLFEGIHLERFKNRNVSVLFCVAGCDNIVDNEGFGDPSPHRSRVLMTFQGRVSARGHLKFSNASNGEEVEYVEQATGIPIKIPARVHHGYLYVVEDGTDETARPPEVFGRLRLFPVSEQEERDGLAPSWKTVRYDTSVVEAASVTPDDYSTFFKGGQLGSRDATSLEVQAGIEEFEADTMVQPSGAMCCAAQGPPLKLASKKYKKKGESGAAVKRWCHVDLLAARRMIAASDTADMHIVLELHVYDGEPLVIEDIQASPNPMLMQRQQIEVMLDNPGMPTPPICFVARAVHKKTWQGARSSDLLICRIRLKTRNLDSTLIYGEFDPNKVHQASWVSLDGRFNEVFSPTNTGGTSAFWKGRPRLLVAAGYSEHQSQNHLHYRQDPRTKHPIIQTERHKKFEIDLSVLGLRDLKDWAGHDLMPGSYTLEVKSWWDESKEVCRLIMDHPDQHGEYPSPNFRSANTTSDVVQKKLESSILKMFTSMDRGAGEEEDLHEFKLVDKVKPHALRLKLDSVDKLAVGDDIIITDVPEQGAPPRPRPHSETRQILDVEEANRTITLQKSLTKKYGQNATVRKEAKTDQSQFLGQKLKLPIYDCQVVPYLQPGHVVETDQPQLAHSLRGTRTAPLATPRTPGVVVSHDLQIVLLPDLVFQILEADKFPPFNNIIRSAASVTLPLTTLLPRDLNPSMWSERCAQRFQEEQLAHKLYKQTEDIVDQDTTDPVVEQFIDVFACQDGYVKFDKDLRIGRALGSQRLFKVWTKDPRNQAAWTKYEREKAVNDMRLQKFNVVDEMSDDPTQISVPYNSRFMPTFFNGEWTGDMTKPTPATTGWQPPWVQTKLTADANRGDLEVKLDLNFPGADRVKRAVVLEFMHEAHTPGAPAQKESRSVEAAVAAEGKIQLEKGLVHDWKKGAKVVVKVLPPGNRIPKPPEQMFALLKDKIDPTFIEKAALHDLKAACDTHGIRCCTREAAPESRPELKLDVLTKDTRFYQKEEAHRRQCNSHTFVRRVGHVVKPQFRQSQILARLRMGLPSMVRANAVNDKKPRRGRHGSQPSGLGAPSTDQSEAAKQAKRKRIEQCQMMEENTCNFLHIKCNKPAVVVWAPPDDVVEFKNVSDVLFVLQLLDGTEQKIVITVPSTDLRFPNESTWWLKKTMCTGWGDLSRQIYGKSALADKDWDAQQDDGDAADDAQDEGDSRSLASDDEAEDDDNDVEQGEIVDDFDPDDSKWVKAPKIKEFKNKSEADGYSQAIPISKWAFVCRLQKRGLPTYHRRQTANYYRATMGYFPEFAPLGGLENEDEDANLIPDGKVVPQDDPKLDFDMSRERVHRETLNLRCGFEAVGDSGITGMLKGHLKIKELNEEQAADAEEGWYCVVGGRHKGDELSKKAQRMTLQDAREHAIALNAVGFTQVHLAEGKEPEDSHALADYWFHAKVLESDKTVHATSPTSASRTNLFWREVGETESRSTKRPPTTSFVLSRNLGAKLSATTFPSLSPISNMWVSQSVRVVVYIFSLREFPAADYDIKPYVTVEVPGQDPKKFDQVEDMPAGETDLDIYWQTDFITTLPQCASLKVKLWHYTSGLASLFAGPLGASHDTEIGVTTIDLEDRYLSLMQREFRLNTRDKTLQRLVAPKDTVAIPVPDLDTDKGFQNPRKLYRDDDPGENQEVKRLKMSIQPRKGPLVQAPIEYRALLAHHAGRLDENKGTLRYCVEIMNANEPFKPVDMTSKRKTMQISIEVQDVRGIAVFRDSGQRNDVQVVGQLSVKDAKGKVFPVEKRETDVHKWAHDAANFMYVWNFKVEAPPQAATLKLSLIDDDRFSENSAIYDHEMISLDNIITTAYQLWKKDINGEILPNGGLLPAVDKEVVFDCWPDDYPEWAKWEKNSTWAGFCFRKIFCRFCLGPVKHLGDTPQPDPARLRLKIKVFPVDEDVSFVESERMFGEEPAGRVNRATAISNPSGTCMAVCGKSNCDLVKLLLGSLCCLVATVTALVVAYLAIGVLGDISDVTSR